jgi:hypothetical protein
MQMKLSGALALALAFVSACGGDIENENATSSGPGGVAHASECDGPDFGCNDCVGCIDTVTACMDAGRTCGPDCTAYLECAQTSTDAGCSPICCEPCRQAHPQGAAEMDAFIVCLTEQACPTSCADDAEALQCE